MPGIIYMLSQVRIGRMSTENLKNTHGRRAKLAPDSEHTATPLLTRFLKVLLPVPCSPPSFTHISKSHRGSDFA